MPKANVDSCDCFATFIKGANKISSSGRMNFTVEGCGIYLKNDSETIRTSIETNCMVGDGEWSVCLDGFEKLLKAVNLACEFERNSKAILDFKDGKLKFSGKKSKFSLTAVKEEVVQKYLDKPLKKDIEFAMGFTIDDKMLKKAAGASSISCDSAKVYITKTAEGIMMEVNDETQSSVNSMGMVVTEDYYGDWCQPIIMRLSDLSLMNLVGTNKIKVGITATKHIVSESKITFGEKDFVISRVASSALKR